MDVLNDSNRMTKENVEYYILRVAAIHWGLAED